MPMSTIIGIRSNLNVLAGGCGVEGLYGRRSFSNVTTTVPTPPRLRTMLRENLCIEKWVVSVPGRRYRNEVLTVALEELTGSRRSRTHAMGQR